MKGKIFVDSNVLVYLFSAQEPEKRLACQELIKSLSVKNQLVWSTQVMQEYYSVLTKKFHQPPREVKASFSLFQNFELVVNDKPHIEKAIDIQILYGFSFWDSLVISSALSGRCSFLLSEDLQPNQELEGLRIVSPFKS